tara:strand:- start:12571 stop:12864 length:294 start_codon:yes stop_codon:yes gene_type:complete
MRNIFTTIGDQAAKALKVLDLDITEIREYRLTRDRMAKRAILSCYLFYELGYRKSEIAFYTHKENGTIGTSLKTYKHRWEEIREDFINRIEVLNESR